MFWPCCLQLILCLLLWLEKVAGCFRFKHEEDTSVPWGGVSVLVVDLHVWEPHLCLDVADMPERVRVWEKAL